MTDAPEKKPQQGSKHPWRRSAPERPAELAVRRSGSQKRARTKSWQIAMTDAEEAKALGNAAVAGLSRWSYDRAALLGSPGARARRAPTVNAVLLAQAIAALNKVGSNLNQIAHVLNTARAAGAVEATMTLHETRAAVRQIIALTGRKDAA